MDVSKTLLHQAGGLRLHSCDDSYYFMEAVKGIEYMSASSTRRPATATCHDNYCSFKLTKDCFILLLIMSHKEKERSRHQHQFIVMC